jgi:hypothetical protein
MHTGYYTPTATLPLHPASELHATIRIIPPQEMYTSMLRNSLRSRSWGGGSGCSYRVERCQIIKEGGGSIELKPCLTHTPAVAATLSPAASEWTVSTRAGCSVSNPIPCLLFTSTNTASQHRHSEHIPPATTCM